MDTRPRPALRWGVPIGVSLLSFLAFLPALGCGWVNWDDPVNFHNNPHYRGLGAEQLKWMFSNFTGHYMPLTWLTLGLDYVLWGMEARGYHLVSLILHSLNAALCYLFLEALLRRSPGGREASDLALRACAAAGALFWAVHPLRVESVAWITERRDLVAGLFTFPCLLAYLRALPAGNAGKADDRWLAASAGFFALSMLGKAIGMTLPLALLVMDIFPLRRFAPGPDGRRPWMPVLAEKLPFLLVMIGGVVMTWIGQERAAAVHEAGAHGPANFLVQPGWRLGFYLGKILVPLGLSPLYPHHRHADPWALKLVATGAAMAALTFLAWKRRREAPGVLAAWAAFAFLLAPVLGPIQAGPHFAADRYTYLAALPFSALAAGALLAWTRRRGVRLPAAVAGAALAVLAVLSAMQTLVWKDSVALWSQAARVDASSSIIFTNRGAAYASRRLFDEAIADFDAAIRLVPNAPKPYASRARALSDVHRFPEAIRDVETAIRLGPYEPYGYLVRGNLLIELGKPAEAIRAFDRALELDETELQAWVKRALARGMIGDLHGSIADAERALLLHPFNTEALLNRARARGELGDLDGAAADYDAAIALEPKIAEAWAGRGMVRGLQNRWVAAAADFERALGVAPSDWPFRADTERRLQEARAKAAGR